MKDAVTYKDIYLSLGEAISIEELEISQSPNRHGEMRLSAVLDCGPDEMAFYEMPETVVVHYMEDGEEKTLFKGTITHSSMRRVGDHMAVRLEAGDATWLLDGRRKTRSFQNISRTSHSVLSEIMEEYPECICMKNIPDEKIGQIWFQYEETDWEFLCRFVSHYSDSLYADATYGTARFQAGLSPQAIDVDWESCPYRIYKDLERFDRLSANGFSDIQPGEFTGYLIDSHDIYTLGSSLRFKGAQWYIGSLERRLQEGILVCTYTLRQKAAMLARKQYNSRITGISVDGKASQVQRDKVRVSLNGDMTREQGTYWFPFSTVAASADGSGWYSMPESGDSVRIYFPTWDEKEGYAITKHDSHMPAAPSSGSPGGGSFSGSSDLNMASFSPSGTDMGMNLTGEMKPRESLASAGESKMEVRSSSLKMASYSQRGSDIGMNLTEEMKPRESLASAGESKMEVRSSSLKMASYSQRGTDMGMNLTEEMKPRESLASAGESKMEVRSSSLKMASYSQRGTDMGMNLTEEMKPRESLASAGESKMEVRSSSLKMASYSQRDSDMGMKFTEEMKPKESLASAGESKMEVRSSSLKMASYSQRGSDIGMNLTEEMKPKESLADIGSTRMARKDMPEVQLVMGQEMEMDGSTAQDMEMDVGFLYLLLSLLAAGDEGGYPGSTEQAGSGGGSSGENGGTAGGGSAPSWGGSTSSGGGGGYASPGGGMAAAKAGGMAGEAAGENPMDDPTKRNIFTQDGNIVQMVPAGVFLTAGKSSLSLLKNGEVRLNAPAGITINTGDHLVLTGETVTLEAGTMAEIKSEAKPQITLGQFGTSIKALEIYENSQTT